MVIVEEPLQEAMVEGNVESPVDMFGENAIPSTTDVKMGKRWGLASSLGNVVARLKQAEVNAKVTDVINKCCILKVNNGG